MLRNATIFPVTGHKDKKRTAIFAATDTIVMRHKYYQTLAAVLSAVLLILAVSCSREDPFGDNTYLLTAEKLFTTPVAGIEALFGAFSVSDPAVEDLMEYIEHDVDVWRVTYRTDIYGEEIVASALVCRPVAAGKFPVLSFQNGTNTLHANAPSVNPSNPSYMLVEDLASMGFIVIIPDYPGFGSSESVAHPYLLKEPTVRSVTSLLAALREFDDDVVHPADAGTDLYLFGYSQGGWATLAIHEEIDKRVIEGFTLKASAAGAGPADLKAMLEGFLAADEYPMPSYFAYIAHAYRSYGWFDLDYNDIFNETYAAKIPGLFNGTLSLGAINQQLTTNVSELLTPEFIAGFSSSPDFEDVRKALADNSIKGWSTSVPLILVHGEGDTQVPAQGTIDLYNEMISSGSPMAVVKIELVPGVDHGDGLLPAAIKSLEFILAIAGTK
ncbi:MAG: alpha/beta fold hydrolase [Bacteroidales bacterium]|jgi:pimeloyl-ACP methyl ester carboxylesterase|nr:alpha/beta fold hydrolase [Bacteroidales bacterium]